LSWITDIAKLLPGFRGSTSVGPMSTAGTQSEDLHAQGYVLSREKSPQLRGRRRYVTYNELVLNTVIVAAGIRYFLNLMANAEWTVQPKLDEEGEPLPGAQEAADFVEDVMGDMETPWSRIIRRAAMYRFMGFSVQEWTAKKRDDGRVGMKDIEARPQGTIERWDLDEGGSVQGCTQWVLGRPETYLPRGKIIYLVDDALDTNPEGTGLLRHLTRSSERLRAYEELEELAFETDLRGIPIGRAPLRELRDAVDAGKMDLAGVRKARSAVDNFVRNKLLNKAKGAVLDSETYSGLTADGGTSPSGTMKWDVDLLQGGATGQWDAAAAIHRVNLEMARLLGVEHLMLGSDGTGSLALGMTKLWSFFLIVSSTLGEIRDGYQRDFVSVTCDLNAIPKELYPDLKVQDIDINDVEAVARMLSQLATAGATLQPDDPAIDVLRGRAGLPPQPEPPELSEEDQALVDRMRAGVPVNVVVPPEDPAAGPADKPVKTGDKTNSRTQAVKPGSEGAAAQSAVKKLLATLLGHPPGPRVEEE
jgi:hypothetical protein